MQRRGSAIDGGPPSPRPDFPSTTPKIPASPRFAASPLIGAGGHSRPPTTGPYGAETASFWGTLLGRAASGSLPTHGGRRVLTRGGAPAPSRVELLRNIILRPIYILGRRGPIFPLAAIVACLFFFITYSTGPSTPSSYSARMGSAVRPYIPQRAADAFNWRSKRRHGALRGGAGGAVAGGEYGGGEAQTPLMGPDDGLARKYAPVSKPPPALPVTPPRPDGRTLLVEGQVHPIPGLIAKAKQDWEKLQARQSTTFEEAVNEYVKRYGRRPPAGFDKWYAFAKAHKVLMIDEFDLINNDLEIYHAFKPEIFRNRTDHLEATFDTTWTIRVENGKAIRAGPLEHHNRAYGVVDLMKRFVHELPDMKMVYNGHDGARVTVTAEERERLEKLAKEGLYDKADAPPYWPELLGPEPHHSMPVFCPPGSAVRAEGFDYGWPNPESTGYEMPPLVEGSVGSLIDNFSGYMDTCNSPQYRHFHATTSWVYAHHPTEVLPLLTPGVQDHFADIHSIIVEQLDLAQEHDPTWEERPFTSLQWRGQTSGPLWEAGTPWKTTQRARLHLLSHQETGSRKIAITNDEDVIRVVEVPNYRVNPLFLDAGMIGPAVQCIKEDGTCDKMYEVFQGYDKRISFDRASLYKYVLDVDGNSWSGRFRRLMLSNAAVVKTTIFREFWTDWAIPWLHFIPMQVDYSDMWDIMAFFRGGLNGEGAHDDLGKEIADAGKEWVKLCFRWPDLEAYQYRLMLEYGRLWNDETSPGSNDFNGDATIEPEWTGDVKFLE